MTVFINRFQQQKIMLQYRYIPEIPDIHMCYKKSYKIGWTYNIFILASDVVILSHALSGQQIRVVLRSWSETFTYNFDAQFGAILRTWKCVVGAAWFYHGLKNTIFYHIFSIISKRRPVPPYRDYIFLKILLLPKYYKKMVQNKRNVFIFQCKIG